MDELLTASENDTVTVPSTRLFSMDALLVVDNCTNPKLDNSSTLNSTCWLNATSQPRTFPYIPLDAKIIAAILFIIMVVGVVGNGILIWIVCLNKKMRNVPNVFIACLALGDIMLLVMFIPFGALTFVTLSWPLGEPLCKIINAIQFISNSVSVFTLTALSADRFNAIVMPINIRSSGVCRALTTAAVIWLISAILGIPLLVTAKLVPQYYYEGGPPYYFCQAFPHGTETFARIFEILRFFVLYLIPLIVIAVFYITIALTLFTSSRKLPGETKKKRDMKQVKARRRLAKIVLGLVVIFAIFWAPYYIFSLWFRFYFDFETFDSMAMFVFRSLGLLLASANSCINPLALCFLSKTYRSYFRHYLFCRRIRTTATNGTGTSFPPAEASTVSRFGGCRGSEFSDVRSLSNKSDNSNTSPCKSSYMALSSITSKSSYNEIQC